jgi:integration host factor subunit beta
MICERQPTVNSSSKALFGQGRFRSLFMYEDGHMHTVTKKELVDRIADQTTSKRVMVKQIIQGFLDEVVSELGSGNRLEFRDFGVFEVKERAARIAQNPKTLQRVNVPPKRTVKFKAGRMMKIRLQEGMAAASRPGSQSTTGAAF